MLTTAVRPFAPPLARTRVLLGLSLSYFAVLLDTTVLAVAEPDLARSLGSSTAGLQWVVTAYTVAFGAVLLSAGTLADRFGADRLFRLGVAGFGAASAACALAPGLWSLVVWRAVLGVAAALSVPSGMALLGVVFPVPAERARAVSVWAGVSGAAMACGPVVGGALVGWFGWRSVFWLNVPLTLLVLALTASRGLRAPRRAQRTDWWSQAALVAGLALLIDALIAAGAGEAGQAAVAGAGALVAGGWFVRRERDGELRRVVLAADGVRTALAAGAAVNFALLGVLFVLPLVFVRVWGWSAAVAGAAFLPMTVSPAGVPLLLTGRLVARRGPWLPVVAGAALLAAGCAGAAAAVGFGASYPVLAMALGAVGFGVALSLPALVAAVVSSAPAGATGAASGLLNAVRQVGASLGVAVLGALVAVPDRTGAATALLLPVPVCAVAAVLALGRARRTSSRHQAS
ncbi:MFS transporter [Streptomyces sp. TLI_171]|uniref:MFS transporter n=1 Tax=Streptomyces sp. TLI_171 TaxID=1938859 RepID=UPI000C3F0BCD|nr:MFS transporter [Streptomyces sp. TLI_171]RKE16922.1 DHA2 family methylenomycin A resistance protein-like MFS transporter [Streptomyces sp. TLI_171]